MRGLGLRLVEFSAKACARRYLAPRPARNAATPLPHIPCARIHTSRSSFCRIERQNSFAASAYAATSRPVFPVLAPFGPDWLGWRRLFLRIKRTSQLRAPKSENDPTRTHSLLCFLQVAPTTPRSRSKTENRPGRISSKGIIARTRPVRSNR